MMGNKICFYGEIWLIIPKLSLLPLHTCSWSTGFSVGSGSLALGLLLKY